MSTLDRYLVEREEQSPIDERELQIEENPQLEAIIDAYKRWLGMSSGHLLFSLRRTMPIDAELMIEELEYSPEDVAQFSLYLKKFEHDENFENSGYFLSALINEGEHEEYTLVTEHLEKDLDVLGYRNSKTITVLGNAGICAGQEMESGSLTITGDAGVAVGYRMSGGLLTVAGNVGFDAARRMSNGRLHIHGNVDGWAGAEMRGGELIVDGKIENITTLREGGRIYEGGKLVRGTEDAR